jgi:hypothetical protein
MKETLSVVALLLIMLLAVCAGHVAASPYAEEYTSPTYVEYSVHEGGAMQIKITPSRLESIIGLNGSDYVINFLNNAGITTLETFEENFLTNVDSYAESYSDALSIRAFQYYSGKTFFCGWVKGLGTDCHVMDFEHCETCH